MTRFILIPPPPLYNGESYECQLIQFGTRLSRFWSILQADTLEQKFMIDLKHCHINTCSSAAVSTRICERIITNAVISPTYLKDIWPKVLCYFDAILMMQMLIVIHPTNQRTNAVAVIVAVTLHIELYNLYFISYYRSAETISNSYLEDYILYIYNRTIPCNF